LEQALTYLQPDVVSKLANMELRARMVVEGFITGMHKSPYHGFSVEFAEHRQYMPGDEIRSIDWKVYGKTDRYYIKQYEEETNLKSYIILDASASMSFASENLQEKGRKRISKLEYASYVVAALSYLMVQQRDAVGLTVYDESIRLTLPRMQRKHTSEDSCRLEIFQPERQRELHNRCIEWLSASPAGAYHCCQRLLDDPGKVMAALKHFRHNHHDVLVMQVLDPFERRLHSAATPCSEISRRRRKLTTQPYHIQRAYQQEMRAFLERYKRECRETISTTSFSTQRLRSIRRCFNI